jgi:hypothetical protein
VSVVDVSVHFLQAVVHLFANHLPDACRQIESANNGRELQQTLPAVVKLAATRPLQIAQLLTAGTPSSDAGTIFCLKFIKSKVL